MEKIPKTILLVEDDRDQQRMYGIVLKKAGFRVSQALDGKGALAQAKQEKPNLIILDILMGGMNGIELLKRLKADNKFKDIPIIILTNYTKEETLMQAKKLGAQEIIIKTDVVPHELARLVRKKYLPE